MPTEKFYPPPGSAAARLLESAEDVLSRWANVVRQKIKAAQNERHPIIIDTLPAFLENLAQALAPNYPRKLATDDTTIGMEHGGERARVTRYSPSDLIAEYQLLRDTIFETMNETGGLSQDETYTVVKSIDQAMSESLTAYFLIHEGLREQFAVVLTHDLRTPLSAIKMTADLILRYPGKTSEVPRQAARIAENADRIDRMIQDLLDASRVRFGEKIKFEVEEFDLQALVQKTLHHSAAVHGDRFTFKGDSVQGFWNQDAFRRALENLITNAVKYGAPNTTITVKLQAKHGRAILSVHNEGPAIPIEEQETLFHSFMRTKMAKNGKRPGWGLGLAMVRGMAEGHGGSIAVGSAPGRGTTFIIDVPVDARPFLDRPATPGSAA